MDPIRLRLIKIPLLCVVSVTTQLYLTAPDTRPDAAEEAKYSQEHKVKDAVPSNVWAPVVFKLVSHAMNALEILAIVSSSYSDVGTVLTTLWSRYASISGTGNAVCISPTFLAGLFLSVTGTYIRVACFRHLGRQFTFQLTIRKNHKLVTSGPYAIVRHPGYTALFMCFAGTILCQLGPGSLWKEGGMWSHSTWRWFGWFYAGYRSYVALCIFRRISREDMVLKKEFGSQWEAWANRTPYKLIPLVY